jgi:hypothetical protein
MRPGVSLEAVFLQPTQDLPTAKARLMRNV